MIQKRSVLGALTGLAMTLALAACSTPEAKAPPAPPAPALPAPPITLSTQLFSEASAWRTYMTGAAAISPKFGNGAEIAASLRLGAAYEPKQLLRGAIAYSAVVALQEQDFVSAVRVYANNPEQRARLIAQYRTDPYSVTSIPGSSHAAGQIIAALGGESSKVLLAGWAVKQAAYDVQAQKWSKEFVPNRDGRLAEVRVLSETPTRGNIDEVTRMQAASLSGGAPVDATDAAGASTSVSYSPVVYRGLALAAIAALGGAGDDQLVILEPLFTDEPSAFCLRMSKLMLYQCLAAAKPHYEDMFCIGQHELIDTAQCTLKSAGAPMPIDPTPRPVAVAKPTKAPAKAPAKPAAKPAAKPKTK